MLLNAVAGECAPERRCDLLGAAAAAAAASSRPFILTGSCVNGRIICDWLSVGGCYVTRSGRGRAMFAAPRRCSAANTNEACLSQSKGHFWLFILKAARLRVLWHTGQVSDLWLDRYRGGNRILEASEWTGACSQGDRIPWEKTFTGVFCDGALEAAAASCHCCFFL